MERGTREKQAKPKDAFYGADFRQLFEGERNRRGSESILLLTIVLLTMWLKHEKKNLLLWKYYIWKFLV